MKTFICVSFIVLLCSISPIYASKRSFSHYSQELPEEPDLPLVKKKRTWEGTVTIFRTDKELLETLPVFLMGTELEHENYPYGDLKLHHSLEKLLEAGHKAIKSNMNNRNTTLPTPRLARIYRRLEMIHPQLAWHAAFPTLAAKGDDKGKLYPYLYQQCQNPQELLNQLNNLDLVMPLKALLFHMNVKNFIGADWSGQIDQPNEFKGLLRSYAGFSDDFTRHLLAFTLGYYLDAMLPPDVANDAMLPIYRLIPDCRLLPEIIAAYLARPYRTRNDITERATMYCHHQQTLQGENIQQQAPKEPEDQRVPASIIHYRSRGEITPRKRQH